MFAITDVTNLRGQLDALNAQLSDKIDCISNKKLDMSSIPTNNLFKFIVDFATSSKADHFWHKTHYNSDYDNMRENTEFIISSKIFRYFKYLVEFHKSAIKKSKESIKRDLHKYIDIQCQHDEHSLVYKFTVNYHNTKMSYNQDSFSFNYWIFSADNKIVVEIGPKLYLFTFRDIEYSLIVIKLLNQYNDELSNFYDQKYLVASESIASSSHN